MYKYNCRKCPIRNRCIQESDNSPSAKEMIVRAFTARTDTLATWGVLQKNCLLVKAEEEREKRASQESLLSRRLREKREASKPQLKPLPSKSTQSLDQAKSPPPTSSSTTPRSTEALRPGSIGETESRWTTSPLERSPTHSFETGDGDNSAPATPRSPQSSISAAAKPCWLTNSSNHHPIRLPLNGELVLGRFDPSVGVPPDIDLSFEDKANTISRRHAKIVGASGRHTIEDLGSLHGVFINSEPVKSGPSRQLRPGDQISLGNLRFYYDFIPSDQISTGPLPGRRHALLVTATGQKLSIAPPQEITIGRSDRYVNFVPDIDLSPLGEVAVRVSRRHAIITWRNYVPHLEDLGSGFGTRLNGEMLLIGQAVPLKPGDHIWLGGCVLAYEAES